MIEPRAATTPAVALAIGGSDSGSGAGIQADLKTLSAHRVYAATVLTAVTAQNTLGVSALHPVPAEVVVAQIEAVIADLHPSGAKTGFLARVETVDRVVDAFDRWKPRFVVVDPVLVSHRGEPITDEATRAAYLELMSRATVVTPNHREVGLLTGREVDDGASLAAAAEALASTIGRPVLATGGRMPGGEVLDAFVAGDGTDVFRSVRIASSNVHGTGCSLASSITARLVLGAALPTAVEGARAWVHAAISGAAAWRLGSGQGPIDHFGWAETGC